MTNEELAKKAKSGDNEARSLLWENVKRFVYKISLSCFRRYNDRCSAAGVQLEDLQQEGFIAVLDAVKAFDSESGYKFIAFLRYPLRNHFNELLGFRTKADRVLNSCDSLDKTLPDTDCSLTVMDSVPDDSAIEAFEAVDEEIYIDELRKAEEETLSRINKRLANIIRDRYFNNLTLKEIGDKEGLSLEYIRMLSNKGMRLLRKPQISKNLKPFAVEYAGAYFGTGFQSWYHNGSVEERLIEKGERRTG